LARGLSGGSMLDMGTIPRTQGQQEGVSLNVENNLQPSHGNGDTSLHKKIKEKFSSSTLELYSISLSMIKLGIFPG
jgi:hypothetical protein